MSQKKSSHFLTRFPLRKFIFFSAVGAIGTGVHFAVLILSVKAVSLDPVVGSIAGFAAGALVNYFLNYHLTFCSRQFHLEAMPKFMIIASIGLLLNSAAMFFTTKILFIHYLVSQAIATSLVLLWNFVGNCCWTFREETSVVGK